MSAVDKARAAWGDPLPDWIKALAEACDATSQAKAAERIGYSPAVVSHVLRAAYPGDLTRVEGAVRGAFMAAEIDCPGQNRPIPTDECIGWQRRPYDGGNHLNVTMFRACRACPNARGGADAALA